MKKTWLSILLLTAVVGCPKNRGATLDVRPDPGWTFVGETSTQCFFPPDFAAEFNEIKRKELRSAAWNELRPGLSGELPSAPAMDPDRLDSLELVLLGHPERIEGFADEAWRRCRDAAESGGVDGYVAWLDRSADELSADDCNRPLIYEVHDAIQVQNGWHLRFHMCEGDRIRVEVGSGARLYTVYDTGDPSANTYHGVLGDPVNPTSPGAPCQECRAGELLLRFEDDAGGGVRIEPLVPQPADTDLDAVYARQDELAEKFAVEYTAPAHGHISFSINDDTYYDNLPYEDADKGYTEYVSFDLYPIIGEGEMMMGF